MQWEEVNWIAVLLKNGTEGQKEKYIEQPLCQKSPRTGCIGGYHNLISSEN